MENMWSRMLIKDKWLFFLYVLYFKMYQYLNCLSSEESLGLWMQQRRLIVFMSYMFSWHWAHECSAIDLPINDV